MDVINTFSCFAWWWSFKKRVIIIVFLGAYDSEDHGCFGCSVRRFFLGKTIFVKKKMTKISSYTSKLFLFFYFFGFFGNIFWGFGFLVIIIRVWRERGYFFFCPYLFLLSFCALWVYGLDSWRVIDEYLLLFGYFATILLFLVKL